MGRWAKAAAAFAVAAAGLTGAGCQKLQAKTPPPAPPVETAIALPSPPGRLILPVSVETLLAPDKPAPAPTAKPETTKPVPPSPPPATGGPPSTPPQVLQPGTNPAELEARAKERLDRADRDLARVKYGSLGNDARDQYDSALRFIRMGRDALTARNFVYAVSCADKAVTLASLLVK